MSRREKEIWEEEKRRIAKEVQKEVEEMTNNLQGGYGIVSFTSRSNGKDRKRRKPREVELLLLPKSRISREARAVKDDKLADGSSGRLSLDKMAQECGFGRSDEFLNALRRRRIR
ncbi:MAG: hypothetical protein WC686_02380 [Candidatus Shapirobacteria bacterium]|jgi:hypothetical protein